MSNKETIHSHYHIKLEKEIHRTLEQLKSIGINNVTKLEVTAFIAEKNKLAKISIKEVMDFFYKFRGLK